MESYEKCDQKISGFSSKNKNRLQKSGRGRKIRDFWFFKKSDAEKVKKLKIALFDDQKLQKSSKTAKCWFSSFFISGPPFITYKLRLFHGFGEIGIFALFAHFRDFRCFSQNFSCQNATFSWQISSVLRPEILILQYFRSRNGQIAARKNEKMTKSPEN